MEWLKKLAARLRGKPEGRVPAQLREVQEVRGAMPVPRALAQTEPQSEHMTKRTRAEDVVFAFAKSEQISAAGVRAAPASAELDAAERMALYCRRCASDIAAQGNL